MTRFALHWQDVRLQLCKTRSTNARRKATLGIEELALILQKMLKDTAEDAATGFLSRIINLEKFNFKQNMF